MSNNVISFPTKNINNNPETLEDVEDNIENIKMYHVQRTVETIIPWLFDCVTASGFEPSDEETGDEVYAGFMVESIRALLYKSCDMYHPFHGIAEKMIVMSDNGGLKLASGTQITIDIPNQE
jgi:hypothetical protein